MRKLTLLTIVALAAPTANTAIIYDTLEGAYTSGNGNCFGGSAVFGMPYDLMVADDFSLVETTTITSITVRNLTFGAASANQAYLRVLRDNGGHPGAEVTGPEGDLVEIVETDFFDPVFDLVGKDVHASELSYTLSPGTYWIGLQVISDDWHYTASGQYGMGSNGHQREWIRGGNCWCDTDWHDDYHVDYNMRIEGDVVPEPMTVVALSGSLIALAARRRRN